MDEEILTFYLNEQLFGIKIIAVKEIIRKSFYDKIAGSKDYILGLLNLRGQIVTIIDLKKIIYFDKNDNKYFENNCSCIILKKNKEFDELIGFSIDKPGEVIQVNSNEIKNVPTNIETKTKGYIEGVVETKEGTLAIISLKKIFYVDKSQIGGDFIEDYK